MTSRSVGLTTASERFEFRLAPIQKQALTAAANLLGLDVSEYVRQVLAERTQEILAERESKTVVPAWFFDELVAALDEPLRDNDALKKATQKSRASVKTDYPW